MSGSLPGASTPGRARLKGFGRDVLLLGALHVLFSLRVCGQTSVEIQQAFLDLSHDEVMMNLSAHPDDEDGAALAYYRMKYGIKTYSVLFTRGEGGQNETGPELYEELGVLRSAETEAAGRVLGTEVRFLNFIDFGYSKTATETFRMWGGEREVLRRLVYIIRKLKPDVLFTSHNTISGHGNHQAVAITAIAAFDAAADSTYFPEQLKEPGVSLWQPRKMYFRNFGRADETADVTTDVNEINPLRQESYVDLAVQALRMHKTQGMGRVNVSSFMRSKRLYRLVRQNSFYEGDTTSFFSGINLWDDPELTGLRPIRTLLASLSHPHQVDSTLQTVSFAFHLIDSVRLASHLSARAWRVLNQWDTELEHLVQVLCGIDFSLTLNDQTVVPRQRVECTLGLTSTVCSLSAVSIQFTLPQGWSINEAIGVSSEIHAHTFKREYELIVSDLPVLTLPRVIALYRPIEADEHIIAHSKLDLNGIPLRISCSPTFDVAPPQLITITPKEAHIRASHPGQGKTFRFVVRNYLPHKTAGVVRCIAPRGWRTESASYVISSEDSTATGSIFVAPPDSVKSGEDTLRFRTGVWNADAIVRIFDVTVPRTITVGVIRSYDTTLENSLSELGVQYRLLDPHEVETGDLAKYTTLLVDIRAYLVRDDLCRFNNRLLEYVRQGGNMVVMYQRQQEWKPEYAPYPFRISGRRVTVEETPVEVLQPTHPLLNEPNRISDADWLGWKQERGVYFPSDVAPEYRRLLSMHDPDEPALTTGYLVADVGKGSYIYTSLVWYRELKEMVPGAFRCFANMISYPLYRK